MWNAIVAIITTLLGFGAGSAGLINNPLDQKVPITPYLVQACYDPQPNVKFTLKWPDNFVNVPDRRPELNPNVWGDKNLSPNFNANASCQTIAMGGKGERTYILVRKEVRIPSCKTDELAGPYGNGVCHGWNENAPELTHRGVCTLDGYTDLRKIAETKDENGQTLEIFWNPFSYNVGCNYKQDENCGPGDRRNINLKDFIYVLKKRDAFDPDRERAGCPVRWDAGATNGEACSHFFDVYMAEDFYQETKSAPATNDPESPYYFVKQVLENCKEETTFIPVLEANLTMPPIFIKTPFIRENQQTSPSFDKIIPSLSSENVNYLTYIWGRPDLIVSGTTNLLQTNVSENKTSLNLCKGGSFKTTMKTLAVTSAPTPLPLTIAPLADCYDPIGNIYFKDDKGATVAFKVYSKPATPETFYLLKVGAEGKTYVYTVTDKDYPSNTRNDPSLQLRVMQMIMKNVWTWATPWCKPAIYLYPEKPTDINVKLALDGQLTVSSPTYDEKIGWQVRAYPDGTLRLRSGQAESAKDTSDGGEATTSTPPRWSNQKVAYPYLYYEADLKGMDLPKEGFVYSREDLPESLKSLMEKIGFNDKEISDFMEYWLPRLSEKPYYFVTLMPENVINDKEKLTFCHPEQAKRVEGSPTDCKKSITPDTLIRSRFVFEGLDAPIRVRPLTNLRSDPVTRLGFTVTDWGGTIVGKSCTEVSVK
ncbi:hypothetical protein HZB96_01155 [Candidatus Gottesmanbacteria bacterium]|nr:hypothetical protein [Candidatus Gottesmanbacteria bacterium]